MLAYNIFHFHSLTLPHIPNSKVNFLKRIRFHKGFNLISVIISRKFLNDFLGKQQRLKLKIFPIY